MCGPGSQGDGGPRWVTSGLLLLAMLVLAGCDRGAGSFDAGVVTGTVENDQVRVGSRYGGRVVRLGCREGDTVKTGQPIVELDAPELLARRAHAAGVLAESENGSRPEELAAARAEWEAQAADLEFATLEAARARQLFEEKALPESDRDRAESRVRVLEKSLKAAQSRHALLVSGTRVERVAQAKAQLAEIDSQLRELVVSAPSDCVVESLQVRVGDVAAPNQDLATLLLADAKWVRVYVPETWLSRVIPGTKARVAVDAFPDRRFEGVVEQVARVAEFTPRNVQTQEERVKQVFGVKVRLSSSDPLRAGMSADVTFEGAPR